MTSAGTGAKAIVGMRLILLKEILQSVEKNHNNLQFTIICNSLLQFFTFSNSCNFFLRLRRMIPVS